VHDDLYSLAREVCTAKQFDAWRLEAAGMSQRHIALALGISRSAARARLSDAHTRLAYALSGRAEDDGLPPTDRTPAVATTTGRSRACA